MVLAVENPAARLTVFVVDGQLGVVLQDRALRRLELFDSRLRRQVRPMARPELVQEDFRAPRELLRVELGHPDLAL